MKKVLVIGDTIVDNYTHVTTDRMAQEADIPVYDFTEDEEPRLGGAANVALNLKALGGDEIEVELASIAKSDAVRKLHEQGVKVHRSFTSGDQIEKHRVVLGKSIVVRIDNKKSYSSEYLTGFKAAFKETDLSCYDLIVISDYCKGTIDRDVAKKICQFHGSEQVVVDSKRDNLKIFAGAKYLNINEEEYSKQVGKKDMIVVDQVFTYVLVTLGARGAELRQFEHQTSDDEKYTVHTELFPTKKVEAVDVTGCGDTHTAAFSLGVLRDPNDIRGAVRYANEAATIAVQKFGTTKVTRWDFSKKLVQ